MNKHKIVWFAALALTLLVSALRLDSVALAQSPPTKAVTWRYQKTGTIDPGKVWIDKNGYHIRNRVDIGRISGDIQGSALVVYNADFVNNYIENTQRPIPPPLNGIAYGKITISTNSLSSRPTYAWKGTWIYKIQAGKVVSGSLDALNFEKTKRMRIDKVYQDPFGLLVHRGFIDWLYCERQDCPGP